MAKTSIKKGLGIYIQAAEKKATAEYTAKLRQHAEAYGWPSEVIEQLTIKYDGKHHQIKYPEHIQEKIMELEYGTPATKGMPAMTSFVFGQS
jgi:hypothetical protein